MAQRTSLPVLMPSLPDQRWACRSCGQCCRLLVGHLFEHERRRLDEQGWERELDAPPYIRLGRSWALNKRQDGACVFLTDDNRCLIHARFGESAKPVACRIYPFSVTRSAKGWRVSLRYDCPSAQASHGKPISEYRGFLRRLVRELDGLVPIERDDVELVRGVAATDDELDILLDGYRRWITSCDLSIGHRLIGAARLTEALAEAKLARLRGSRLADVMEVLLLALPAECASPPEPCSARQIGMIRQLAFAHAEHVGRAELRGGLMTQAKTRWRQLRTAGRFRRGSGVVPELPGYEGEVAFTTVESVVPAGADTEAIDDLVRRYVLARIEGRTLFGAGYYGWPAVSGLGALWTSMAAAGWLARYDAAIDGRASLTLADVGRGIAVVDRAASRLPALGTTAERLRLRYLLADDGIARSLREFSFVELDDVHWTG